MEKGFLEMLRRDLDRVLNSIRLLSQKADEIKRKLEELENETDRT